MSAHNFRVSYEIVTPESAECGDADERGMLELSCSLRKRRATMRNDYDAHEALVRAATLERWYAYRVDAKGRIVWPPRTVDKLDAQSLPTGWILGCPVRVMR